MDQFSSGKTSEERRISHIPNLETIDDQSYTQTFLEREFDNMINYAQKDQTEEYLENKGEQKQEEKQQQLQQPQTDIPPQESKKSTKSSFPHNNLTESSSSGSVTDSVCTAYEQNDALAPKIEAKSITKDFLQKEAEGKSISNTTTKKEEGNGGLTSMFGGKYFNKTIKKNYKNCFFIRILDFFNTLQLIFPVDFWSFYFATSLEYIRL